MGVWKIYHKDGTILKDANGNNIDIRSLEYSDAWMGECYLTVTFRHETPIVFMMGDYIIYRNEKFVLNYEPGQDKKARFNTYGDGFVYDSVKFNSLQNELSDAEFFDVVLNDNELHYTTLPKFQFYVETLDDLLDRIQANLNEQIGAGKWKIFSRNKDRSEQRGCTAEEWNKAYGDETGNNVIDSTSITADTMTCWDALALVNSKWNVNFIVRGRNVYVGTAGVTTEHMFEYGRGNGLYEIEQNADSDQKVITRLRAYGSEKNLPSHYYADLGVKYVANITKVVNATTYVDLDLDIDYIETYFKNPRKYIVSGETGEQSSGWVLKVTFDFKTEITGYVTQKYNTNKCRFYSEFKGTQVDSGDEESKEKLEAFIAQVKAGNTKMYITSGLNKKNIPSSMKEYAENLPNNMSINRLMLPGFPHVSLSDFYDSLTDEEKKYVNPTGKQHRFSTDPHRPYIDSVNIEQIGLHSASQFFDTDDKTNGIIEIYPTIEEMVIGGVRVDEIDEGVAPDDDGRFNDNENVKNVDIYLSKAVDFDINDLKDDDFSISMKDGMCGGRTFKVASSTKVDGRWRLTIERIKDDTLELWFPYKDYPIRKGDHFVLTGITLPDSYVNAASLKLLKYAIALLEKNDYTRYVYQPKVDEIFMARQHDAAMADETGAIKSLHDTLKAGDLMDFRDDDLNISGTITIDQLNIKEQDGKIPTYEITLREDKEVGTIQKIQQQITSLESGNGGSGGGGGITLAQVKGQVATEGRKYFLSKLFDDTVKGTITFEKVQLFLKGLFFGQGYGFNERGQGIIKELTSDGFNSASQQGFGIKPDDNGRYSLSITDLIVWGKAVFNELEIRKVSYAGGNVYLSGAGSKLVKVVPVAYNSEKGEYITSTDEECDGWKCYILSEDGTMATQNLWTVGDQARCQTFNIKPGAYDNTSNREYWRCVVAVSSESEYIADNNGESLYGDKKFDWVVLSKTNCLTNSDIPADGDTIVLDGHQIQTGEESNISRTNVLMLESSGADTPRIVGYRGITDFTHKDKDVFVISPSNVTISSSVFKFKAASGQDITIINDRGAYNSAVGYYYYDRVSYDNAYWTFIYNGDKQPVKGITPTEKAVDGTVYWRKDLSGGIKGDDAVSYSVQFSEGTAVISGVTTKALDVTFVKAVGLQIRSGSFRDIGFNGTCVVYVDGVRNDGMTNNLMFGYTYLDIYNAFANEVKGKKSLSVELRDSDNRVVASNIFFFAEKGEKGDKGDQGDKGEQGIKGDKGEDGVDGTDGEDAVSIHIEDAPLIFDTDDNGIVPISISNAAKVKVMKGNLNISNECSNISSRNDLCVNCKKCGATQKAGYIEVSVSGGDIVKNDVVIDGVNQGKVSATSGYAVVQLTYNGITYLAQVPFSVNVAKFTGVVAFDNKSYKQQFKEVTKRLDKAATKDELTHAKSEFEQTARKISLSVSEKSIARRNLLVGSAFLREDNHYILSSDARIEINSGYNGTNCIKVIDDTDGTSHYIGVYWEGSQGGRSIKIEKGKKYTISCYYKANDINANFSLEAIYTDKETNANRLGRPKYLSPNNFAPKKVNEWQLCTTVIDTTDAESDYIAFNFWEYCNSESGRIEAYICRPMVEEGDTYYGWTLSQDDYDIIGANLIDNSRTLDAGGNVIEAKGQKALVGDAYELTASGSDDFNTFYRIKGSTFKLGVGYTISFEVRGDAKYMGVYVSYPVTNTKFTCYKEPQNGAMIEAAGDGTTIGYVALVEVKELSKQQRVWGYFRFKDRLPEELYFQFPSNTEQTGVTSWNVTITKPKIEVGAVATEYTERKSDLVDKASLMAAGVLVDAESVTLYGNQVHIRKDKNSTEDTMLIDNETGKVSAALIDAKKIVAEGIAVQDLVITGSSRSPFSQASAGKDMSYSDNVFLQGNNELVNSYSLVWDTTQSGRLVRLANYNWSGNTLSGYGKVKAPDANHFFFINGEKRSQLYIDEQEMVELLGIGDKTNFIGWAVINKVWLNNYLNGMNVPILVMGRVDVDKPLSGNIPIVGSNVRSFRDFGDYQGNKPTVVIDAIRKNTGVYHLMLQPELAKFLYSTTPIVQVTGIGSSLEDTYNQTSPIKATFAGIHYGSYPKYEGSYIEVWTSDDNTKNDGSFFIEVKYMDYFGSNT